MTLKTKEMIWMEALSLFSKKGYSGVSVKEIAHAVGIKDSSLYKHYESKQSIFDTILVEVGQRMNRKYQEISLPMNESLIYEYENMNKERLRKLMIDMFFFFSKDKIVVQFRKLLTIEQYHNPKLATLYHDYFINGAIDHQTKIFRSLSSSGHLADVNPYVMALHFYSPLFLLLYKYDTEEIKEREIENILTALVDVFYENYNITASGNKN